MTGGRVWTRFLFFVLSFLFCFFLLCANQFIRAPPPQQPHWSCHAKPFLAPVVIVLDERQKGRMLASGAKLAVRLPPPPAPPSRTRTTQTKQARKIVGGAI